MAPRKRSTAVVKREPAPDPLPWEKQKGESQKAFHAFSLYRDLRSTRSLTNVQRTLHETRTAGPSMVATWSRKWKWVERADAFDREEDRQQSAAQAQARADAARMRSIAGQLALGGAISRLRGDPNARDANGQPAPIAKIDLNEADVADVAALMREGSKALAAALGEQFDLRGSLLVPGPKVQEVCAGLVRVMMSAIVATARAVQDDPNATEGIIARQQDAAFEESHSVFRRTMST